MNFSGRKAVVSGGASGIGRAIVEALRAHGAQACSLDLAAGDDPHAIACDVASDGAVAAAAAAVRERIGAPDLVVHAAGIGIQGPVCGADPGAYLHMYNVNALGAMRLAQAFAPDMRAARRGAFVFISSINARFATPNLGGYAASKAALDSLCKTLALELAPDGIRVNTIQPASVATPMLLRGYEASPDPQAAAAANVARHPLGRWGTPDDVAQMALFLLSDASGWVTGSHFPLDGGAGVTRR